MPPIKVQIGCRAGYGEGVFAQLAVHTDRWVGSGHHRHTMILGKYTSIRAYTLAFIVGNDLIYTTQNLTGLNIQDIDNAISGAHFAITDAHVVILGKNYFGVAIAKILRFGARARRARVSTSFQRITSVIALLAFGIGFRWTFSTTLRHICRRIARFQI